MKAGISAGFVVGSFAVVSWAGAAHAVDATCRGYGSLADNGPIGLGLINATMPRVNFIKGSDDDKSCPSDAATCRARAFVVPGNRVIVSKRQGAFVCVDYIGAKGADRAGWLPASTIADETAPPVQLADWMGTWTVDESRIVLKPGATAGEISIKGEATFGIHDPDKVKRGTVNSGEIEGNLAPKGDALSFDMGVDKTLPIDKGDEGDCKVWMKRLGPFLLVDDNNACGGMNVSFRGAYSRLK